MKRAFLLTLTAVVVTAGAFAGIYRAAGGTPTTTASRDLNDAEVRRTMDRVFRAQVRSGLVWTDSLAAECRGEPMYHLMRARLYRELIPVDDESKEVLKQETKALFAELETVVALCDERIKNGDKDDNLRLYRGWAWMLMSHVHTYEKSFWSAGREAKKGKEDLEWYLARHPDDPVASSLMGAFLYFADTLPSAYKFVSKLLFLPTGDRDRGLEMMELARGFKSPMETDNALILYSVYLGFEGLYEEGLGGFDKLRGEFPLHATFVRPEAIMYPLLPGRSQEVGDNLDAIVTRVMALPKEEVDWSTIQLIRFERAFADRFYNPSRAMERYENIMNDDPEHPDWVPGFAAFELGRLRAARGDVEGARAALEMAIRDANVAYLRDDAKAALTALKKYPNGTGLGPADVPAIYGVDEEARKRVRAELAAKETPTIADQFYLGEAWLMSGELDKALDAYTGAINPTSAPWDHPYQMIAITRAAEILGARGEFEAASKHYERAESFWHKEFLLDWVMEARERYFKRLKSGEETTRPTLLTASAAR
jgi:tetratricopeptide (TPR) repeat protein